VGGAKRFAMLAILPMLIGMSIAWFERVGGSAGE